MLNLIKYFNIKSLGITLITGITFTILIIIIQIVNLLYLKRKLKAINKELNSVNYLNLPRRNLKNYKQLSMSLNKALIRDLTSYCQRKKITKSAYLEKLLKTELNFKGGNHNA